MSWLEDKLRPASFRGVPFLVDTAELAGGRRVVEHLYPLRDESWTEDLGLRPKRYPVEAVLIGEDVLEQQARLIAALDTPGAGRLIHPYYGELDVVPGTGGYRVRQSTREGRVCRISIDFGTAGRNRWPESVPQTAAQVDQAAAVAEAEILTAAEETVELAGAGGTILQDALAVAEAVTGAASEAMRVYGLASRTAAGDWTAALGLVSNLLPSDLTGAVAVVRPIFGLARTMAAALDGPAAGDRLRPAGVSTVTRAMRDSAVLSALEQLAATAGTQRRSAPAALGTPQGILAAGNRRRLFLAAGAAAVVEAARAAPLAAYDSRQAAVRRRDSLVAALDEAADAAAGEGWNGGWRGLMDLRTTLAADLTVRAGALPATRSLVLPASRPSLAVAHGLYGDEPGALFERAEEIARRNRVSHPGRIPGGERLEVLDA